MVLLITIGILIVGTALFLTGPCMIETLLDALDAWRELFDRLRERWGLE